MPANSPQTEPGPLRTLARSLRSLFSGQRRSELLTGLLHPGQQLQPATFTRADRYPILFQHCARELAAEPHPRLLSFGCSTGEEVFSLAQLLPQAEIVGVDLNRWCLRQCLRRNTDPRLRFLHTRSAALAAEPPFHAIFCLAVLQDLHHRTEAVTDIRSGFTFARFERQLLALDRKLLPGGLLFLDHCDFLFTDTALSRTYDEVPFPGSRRTRQRPLFDRNNRRIAEQYEAARCFRKRLC